MNFTAEVSFRAKVTTLASVLPRERPWEQGLIQTRKMVDRDSEGARIRDYSSKGFTDDEIR